MNVQIYVEFQYYADSIGITQPSLHFLAKYLRTVLLYVGLDGVDEALDAALDDDVDDAAAEALVASREFQRVRVVRAARELLLLSSVLRNIDG